MKLLLLAVAAGSIVAGVLLDRSADVVNGLHREQSTNSSPTPSRSLQPLRSNVATSGPASHSDATTSDKNVYLNQNIINGDTTTICSVSPSIQSPLTAAIGKWNRALPTVAEGAALSQIPPITIQTQLGLHPVLNTPITVSVDVCRNVDVEIIRRTDRSQPSECGMNGWKANACYDSKRVQSPLPRRYFRTNDGGHKNNSVIYYQREPVQESTLAHELGHVIGLSDYKDCQLLSGESAKSTHDVDPHNQHFSVVSKGSAKCRPPDETVITGRDLRDFYEAYHVGAITGLGLAATTPDGGGRYEITLIWGDDGLDEAAHNASHVAVMYRRADDDWTQLGDAIPIRYLLGEMKDRPMSSVAFGDNPASDRVYAVVGLTRGGIALHQSSLDVAGKFRAVQLDSSGMSLESVTDRFVEGDRALITGISLTPFPGVLTASMSPRYCDVGGSLAMSMHAASGVGDPKYSLLRDSDGLATIVCGAVGVQGQALSATWGKGPNQITRTLRVPYQVHRKSLKLSLVLEVPDRIGSEVPPQVSRPLSCIKGSFITIRWIPSGGVPRYRVWLEGDERTNRELRLLCGKESETIEGFLLAGC